MDNNILSQIMKPMLSARASFALDYPALKSFEMGDTTAASDTLPSLQFPSIQEAQQAAMSLQAPKLPQFVFPEFKAPTYEPTVRQVAVQPQTQTNQTQTPIADVQEMAKDLKNKHNEYLKLISKPLPSTLNPIGGSSQSPFSSFFR